MADSVIDCGSDKNSIKHGFEKLYSNEFQEHLQTVTNPYGNGGASLEIKNILKNVDLENILKKTFYDLNKESMCEHE